MNIITGVWSGTEAVSLDNNSTGFAAQNAHPAAISYKQTSNAPWVVIAYEKPSGSGLRYSWYSYYEEYAGYVWMTQEVGSSISGLVNPSISLTCMEYPEQYPYLSLTMNTSSTVYRAAGYFYQDPYVPQVVFDSFGSVPSSASLSNVTNSVLDIDATWREYITWCAYDNNLGAQVVLVRSRSSSGSWSNLTEYVDDLIEFPDMTSSTAAEDITVGAALLWCDGSTFADVVSTDGLNWSGNGYTSLPNSKFPNIAIKNAKYAKTMYTQNTSSPYAVKYRLWDNSNRLPKGSSQSPSDLVAAIETSQRRLELSSLKDSSSLTVQIGNLSVKSSTASANLNFDKITKRDIEGLGESFLQSSPFVLGSRQNILGDLMILSKGWKSGTVRIQLVDAVTGALLANLMTYECTPTLTCPRGASFSQDLSTNSTGRMARVRCYIDGFDTSAVAADFVNVITVSPSVTGSTPQAQQTDEAIDLPKDFGLSQNYPNPFNPTTAIQYQLPENSLVRLDIYDLSGRKVVSLVNGEVSAGYHIVSFNADRFASGTYVYRLEAVSTQDAGKKSVLAKKMILTK